MAWITVFKRHTNWHIFIHFPFFLSRKFHQAVEILRNHHPAAGQRFRRVVPPQAALQEETEEFRWRCVGLTSPLQDRCVRGTLPPQPDRRLQLHRPLLRRAAPGRGAQRHRRLPPLLPPPGPEQRPPPGPEQHAPLLFPRTRQRQDTLPRSLQFVHWPSEYEHYFFFPTPHWSLLLSDAAAAVLAAADSFLFWFLLRWTPCILCSRLPHHSSPPQFEMHGSEENKCCWLWLTGGIWSVL